MHTSRSVIMPTTAPAASTTGSAPRSCSQRMRATLERVSAGVHARGLLLMHCSTIIAGSFRRASYPGGPRRSLLEFEREVGERALERLARALAEGVRHRHLLLAARDHLVRDALAEVALDRLDQREALGVGQLDLLVVVELGEALLQLGQRQELLAAQA